MRWRVLDYTYAGNSKYFRILLWGGGLQLFVPFAVLLLNERFIGGNAGFAISTAVVGLLCLLLAIETSNRTQNIWLIVLAGAVSGLLTGISAVPVLDIGIPLRGVYIDGRVLLLTWVVSSSVAYCLVCFLVHRLFGPVVVLNGRKCFHCSYDLSWLEDSPCPECGWSLGKGELAK